MKQAVRQYKKSLASETSSIRKFRAQISYLTRAIATANKELPELKAQIIHYEKMLPIWEKDLDVEERSLVSQFKFFNKAQSKFTLASKIDKIKRALKVLNRELQKMEKEK